MRWKTIERYQLGAHLFQIQERQDPVLDKDVYRLKWTHDTGTAKVSTLLLPVAESEGECRCFLLRTLQRWSTSKQFIFKGKLK